MVDRGRWRKFALLLLFFYAGFAAVLASIDSQIDRTPRLAIVLVIAVLSYWLAQRPDPPATRRANGLCVNFKVTE
jgi:hypothetical protein